MGHKHNHPRTCVTCNSDFLGHHSAWYCSRECAQVVLRRRKKQEKAYSELQHAIKQGVLHRGKVCELCGHDWGRIVGHHWNGYDNPLDVWWLCPTCNTNLPGEKYHNGSVTKQQAREVIRCANG